MQITGATIIEDFCKKHTDAVDALAKWVGFVSKAKWTNHNELEADYPSADFVGNKRYVFNIKGNHYRLIVTVVFIADTIEVRFIGTHAEYDKINDIQNI
jgi:mRNA interferase HigB